MIDALKPVVQLAVGAAMPLQSKLAWLSIAPIAEARSSYNGLLVFLFIAISASLAATAIHRFRLRRLAARAGLGLRFSPVRSGDAIYRREFQSADSARLRRLRVPRPEKPSICRRPAQTRAAVFRIASRDPIWEAIYAPIVRIVTALSTRLNHLQFLTIRQYLSVVFGSLVFLLLLLAGWP